MGRGGGVVDDCKKDKLVFVAFGSILAIL